MDPLTSPQRPGPRLGNDEPEARTSDGGSGYEDVEMTRLLPLPPSKKRPDLVGRRDPDLARQREIAFAPAADPARHHVTRGARLPAAVLAADVDHEILPTSTPARIDHPAPAARRHARTESVLVYPLTITRLICRLHRNPFRISRSLVIQARNRPVNIEKVALVVNPRLAPTPTPRAVWRNPGAIGGQTTRGQLPDVPAEITIERENSALRGPGRG